MLGLLLFILLFLFKFLNLDGYFLLEAWRLGLLLILSQLLKLQILRLQPQLPLTLRCNEDLASFPCLWSWNAETLLELLLFLVRLTLLQQFIDMLLELGVVEAHVEVDERRQAHHEEAQLHVVVLVQRISELLDLCLDLVVLVLHGVVCSAQPGRPGER